MLCHAIVYVSTVAKTCFKLDLFFCAPSFSIRKTFCNYYKCSVDFDGSFFLTLCNVRKIFCSRQIIINYSETLYALFKAIIKEGLADKPHHRNWRVLCVCMKRFLHSMRHSTERKECWERWAIVCVRLTCWIDASWFRKVSGWILRYVWIRPKYDAMQITNYKWPTENLATILLWFSTDEIWIHCKSQNETSFNFSQNRLMLHTSGSTLISLFRSYKI